MSDLLQFVVDHGYALVFFWVMAEQVGLPIPATPLLLAAGALAGMHQLNFALVIFLAATGSLVSDLFWYSFGKRKGSVVLGWLCKIALEPDSCVRRTESTFTRLGLRTLLICKFIPGLNTAAPALSATAGIGLPKFLLFDFMGALLWASAFAGLGLAFSKQLDRVAVNVARFGSMSFVLIILAAVTYLGYKYNQRQNFIKAVAGGAHRAGRPEGPAGRGPAHNDYRLAASAGPAAGPTDATRRAADFTGRVGGPAQRDHPRRRNRAVLHLTQRSYQRPCGAETQAVRDYQRTPVAGRLLPMERPGLSVGGSASNRASERESAHTTDD